MSRCAAESGRSIYLSHIFGLDQLVFVDTICPSYLHSFVRDMDCVTVDFDIMGFLSFNILDSYMLDIA